MKTSMLAFSLSVCVAVLSCSTGFAQETNEPDKVKSTPEATMMEGCQQMMKQKQKMMADMQAEDTELTSQLAKLNSSPEDKKMDLLGDIVTQLVKQRAARDASHAKMQEKMMQHMMEHMQMGKESMSQCPMMKGMKGMKGMRGMHKNADTPPRKITTNKSDYSSPQHTAAQSPRQPGRKFRTLCIPCRSQPVLAAVGAVLCNRGINEFCFERNLGNGTNVRLC